MSPKHMSLALGLVLAAASLALPARAQERTDEPSDKLTPTGRTEQPTGGAPGAGHGAGASGGGHEAAPSAEAPEGRPEHATGAHEGAPWSWPWGGAVHSPEWTQDSNWVFTDFWLIDVGHVELEAGWTGSVARRTYEVDQLYQARARIGLLPHIELSISEDATLLTHDHVRQEGNEIGARFAFWDYGTLPLNPALEIVWHPRHGGADGYEARGLLGGELLPGLFIVGNALFEGETGGSHDYTWGFRGAVAYELIHEILRVGCEGGVTWHWNRDHDKTPFRDTAPTVGPTAIFRPLALIRPEWGHYAKLTVSAEFGIRDDNVDQPFMRGGVILAFGF